MDVLSTVTQWIDNEQGKGRPNSDLHETVFVFAPDKVARIVSAGNKFDLEILMPPYVIDFTESEKSSEEEILDALEKERKFSIEINEPKMALGIAQAIQVIKTMQTKK